MHLQVHIGFVIALALFIAMTMFGWKQSINLARQLIRDLKHANSETDRLRGMLAQQRGMIVETHIKLAETEMELAHLRSRAFRGTPMAGFAQVPAPANWPHLPEVPSQRAEMRAAEADPFPDTVPNPEMQADDTYAQRFVTLGSPFGQRFTTVAPCA